VLAVDRRSHTKRAENY